MIRERAKLNDIVYQKNQARDKRYGYTCTITSAILAICDLFDYEMGDKELNEVCDLAISQGLDPKTGWSFYQAVDCARKYWNGKQPAHMAVVSFRIDYGSKEYYTALSYGYSLVCGYQGNSEYNRDKDDGVVIGKEFPHPTYGHCIRKFQNTGIKVIDNYAGVAKFNIYELEDPDALQKNGVFYPSHYVFLRAEDLTQSERDRLQGKTLGFWNGDRENQVASRSECAIMCVRAMKLVTNPGVEEAALAVNAGIWNGQYASDQCTRGDAALMVGRAMSLANDVSSPEGAITRGEIVELLVRAIRQKT